MLTKNFVDRSVKKLAAFVSALAILTTADIAMDLSSDALAATGGRPKIKKMGPGGRQLFDRYCILCHKYMGQGGHSEGGWGKNLRKTMLPREALFATIKYGRTQLGMPAFEGDFTDANLYVITDFILGELRCKEPPETSIEWEIGCKPNQ
jgi:mono/diheme cytochrome c family protein